MTRDESLYIADALEDLLDKEKAALMDGALEDIGRIASEKTRLLESGNFSLVNGKKLDRLRKKAARNQRLLSAAMRGVRRVTVRLEALRGGHGALNTYDQKGQRKVLTSKANSALEKRA